MSTAQVLQVENGIQIDLLHVENENGAFHFENGFQNGFQNDI